MTRALGSAGSERPARSHGSGSHGKAGVRLRVVALVAATLGALATPVLAANGAKLTAYGVRAAGRGGTDYAIADDATGPATNPAGMAYIPNRLDQVWIAARADVDFKNQFGDFHAAPHIEFPIPAYSFGVVIDPSQAWHVGDLFDFGNWGLTHPAKDPPLEDWESAPARLRTFADQVSGNKGDKVEGASVPGASVPGAARAESSEEERLGSHFRIGFGIFPVKGGAFYFNHILTPFWPLAPEYTTVAQQLALTPSVAFRIGEYFSIGFAPQLHYATLKITGPIEQPRTILAPEFQTASTLLASTTVQTYANSHDLTTFGFSGRVGAMFSTPFFSAGVAYQERTYLQDYLGGADVDANIQVSKLTLGSSGVLSIIDGRIQPSAGFHSQYNMRLTSNQPRQIGVGISARPHERVSLSFDYTWVHWSETYRVLKARLTDGTNSNLDVLTSPTIHVHVPLEWEDQHVFAGGASVEVLRGDDIVRDEPSYRVVLRCGYNWGQRPYPASTQLPNTPVFFEHHASVGMSVLVGPYLEFSAAWEHAFFSSVHTRTNAANSDLSNSHMTEYLDTVFFGVGANF